MNNTNLASIASTMLHPPLHPCQPPVGRFVGLLSRNKGRKHLFRAGTLLKLLLKCAAPGATSAAERGTVGKIKLNWKLTGQSVASYNFIIPKAGRGRPSNATGLHADPRSCVSALCFRTALRKGATRAEFCMCEK